MNAIRIAVTGTHSTGKSTFCAAAKEALEAEGYSVKNVTDLATKARDLGFPILHNHTHDSTLWIISQGIAEELIAAIKADVVLIDRAVPDAVGYWLAALEHRKEIPSWDEWSRIEGIVKSHISIYDLLFNTVLDPTVPLGQNQERDKDELFRISAGNQHCEHIN